MIWILTPPSNLTVWIGRGGEGWEWKRMEGRGGVDRYRVCTVLGEHNKLAEGTPPREHVSFERNGDYVQLARIAVPRKVTIHHDHIHIWCRLKKRNTQVRVTPVQSTIAFQDD